MAEKKPGAKKPRPVTQITKVTKPMKKSVVRNPSAPKGTGSGTTVKPITKSETFMKKGKAKGSNAGSVKGATVPKGPKFPASVPEKYKTKPPAYGLRYMDEQTFKRYGYQSDESKAKTKKAAQSTQAGKKPSKVTPKKKAEAPKKATPKRRFFSGRGGGMRGGMGGMGGGGFPGNLNQ